MSTLTRPADGVLSPVRDPLDFIAAALESNRGADELDKLITLHERITKMRAEQAYAEAMRRCQERMPVVVKTKENAFTKTKFAQFENVLAAIKPVYVEEGFALSFGTEDSVLAGHFRCVCDVMHVGGCTRRYFADFPADGQGGQGGKSGMNPLQGIGSMKSYARKYLTFDIFNLTVAGEDTDAAREQVQTDAELQAQAKTLDAIREVYEQTYADVAPESDEEEKFWRWVGCGPGDFNDIPAAKYRDVLTNLKRKLAQKRKAVTA